MFMLQNDDVDVCLWTPISVVVPNVVVNDGLDRVEEYDFNFNNDGLDRVEEYDFNFNNDG